MTAGNPFQFELQAVSGGARAGVLHTPHGPLLTPAFAPVGTQGSVKALTPAQVAELGASLVLANTYHLYLRPGDDLIRDLGGLHAFMGWHGPILTDSGGFQVWSLGAIRRVDDDGVTFTSHIDGSRHRFTPERSIAIQQNLGADIIMCFDELADPDKPEVAERAMQRTHAWAQRCKAAWTNRDSQALFGIVQGGIYEDLRRQSAEALVALDLPGYAIGGLSVGESKEAMYHTLEIVTPLLPADKPRYLMGVGTIPDLINGVARGVDIFDCVLPTREARHGAALTRHGRMNILNARYARDPRPIDESCDCYTCTHFSRAYLRHTFKSREIIAYTLLSIHNLRTLVRLAATMREAILKGEFAQLAACVLADLHVSASSTETR
ncbi:MAG: tRNA guanosine(34) transglycosylase Tgt [Anaerolineae bacterium]